MILEDLYDKSIVTIGGLQSSVTNRLMSNDLVNNLKSANFAVFGALTIPTVDITSAVSSQISARPTSLPTASPYKSENILTIGLVGGLCGTVLLIIVIGLNLYRDKTNSKVTKSLSNNILSFVAVFMAIITMALVSGWAKNPDYTATAIGYLGQPSWDLNVFAWHPVLMVGGFFFSQVCYLLYCTILIFKYL